MAQDVRASQQDLEPPGRLWSESPLMVVPSWAASLVLHGTLLFLVATGLKSCGDGSLAATNTDFREVGIYLKQPDRQAEPAETNAETQQDAQSTQQPAAAFQEPELVDSPPEDALQLPAPEVPLLGPGAAPPTISAPRLDDVIKPSRIAQSAPRTGLGPGEVTFFGVRDTGSRFVYVLDSSGSMSGHDAIQFAKAELIASLAALVESQQFQIIFYNQTPHVLALKGQELEGMYRATDMNRTLTREFIAGIQADLGTDHMPAIRKALALEPDVIFLLTDADVPKLRPDDLEEIRRANNNASRIHCVEFGRGPRLKVENFLKRLARQNGGTYCYRDVTRFRQP